MEGLTVENVKGNAVREQEVERLFRAHYSMLYRTAYGLLGNAEDARDVPQTIFLRLLRNGLPPQTENVKGYLYRAAVNVSLSVLRSRKREVLTDETERLEAPEDTSPLFAEDRHRQLSAAIAQLNPGAAQVIVLRYVNGCSDAEIAKLLGTSRAVIATKLFRARARLRKLLGTRL